MAREYGWRSRSERRRVRCWLASSSYASWPPPHHVKMGRAGDPGSCGSKVAPSARLLSAPIRLVAHASCSGRALNSCPDRRRYQGTGAGKKCRSIRLAPALFVAPKAGATCSAASLRMTGFSFFVESLADVSRKAQGLTPVLFGPGYGATAVVPLTRSCLGARCTRFDLCGEVQPWLLVSNSDRRFGRPGRSRFWRLFAITSQLARACGSQFRDNRDWIIGRQAV
jgi:hypothetical protein